MYRLSSFASVILFFLISCSKNNETDFQNTDPGNCNTNSMKFNTDIVPILQANCNSCHTVTIAPGNIITENYNGVKKIAENGKLVGSIEHASGFIPMPLGRAKLSTCDLIK